MYFASLDVQAMMEENERLAEDMSARDIGSLE